VSERATSLLGVPRTGVEAYRRPVRFAVLGPLEVFGEDGPVPLGGPKQRIVLAHLVLGANRVVSAERLIDALWQEDLPEDPKSTLRVYVSRIRSSLGLDVIEGRSPGYLLKADRDEVDALRFEDLLGEARSNGSESRTTDRILGEALALWRGPALADLESEPSLAGEIARLEELRLEAIEEKAAAELQLGHHIRVVAELETLTRLHPLRERLWGELMLALYRSDRQGEALAAFDRARTMLSEELGIDPSHELRLLHERILRQDADLELQGEPLRGYRMIEQIGEGAFGVVYRASQPQIGREVAIKAVPPELANHPDFVRRFEREAQIVARLEHPHIVPLYDYWREPNAAYLVMRFLRGGSLEDLLKAGPLETARAASILDQVAAALSTAHRQGVVHRDVKPGNVLLDEEGNAYLTDFGVALDAGSPERSTGTMMRGTPAYLSPEQVRLDPASPQTDVYALGIVTYEMLTGVHPFPDSPLQVLLDAHLHDAVPSIRQIRPELPSTLDRVIARATEKEPNERFNDALELAAAFRAAIEGVATVPEPVGEIRNPYKGLRAFLEADTADFFGREALTQRLVRRLKEDGEASRFLAVVGPSGSGKSSVVRAGLVPALRRGALEGSERWYVIDLLPGSHPMRELESALLALAIEPPPSLLDMLEGDTLGLVRATERILPDPDAELVIVLDQLEEVFTLVEDEDERLHVLECLRAAATAAGTRVRVITTLRADFFDQPLSIRGFGDLLAERTEAITPLSLEELERAIVAPADRAGLSVEPRLLAAMIADVADRPGTLPLLQYALTELAERREDGLLTLAGYRRIGGVSGALARRAEQIFGALHEDARDASRQLFLRLVTLGEGSEDTRRRVRRSELLPLGEPKILDGVIDAFGRHRLISFDRDPGTREPTVEIAHEALLSAWDRLRDWIDEAREDIRTQRRLSFSVAEWEASERDPSFLLSGARLEQVRSWAETTTLALAAADRDYVAESVGVQRNVQERERALERRSIRRVRSLVALGVVAALVASTLTTIALIQRGRAERQATVAEAQRLGALAVTQDHLDLALLLAREAVNLDDTVETRGALLTALLRSPQATSVFDVGTQVSTIAVVGETLAVADSDGVTLYDRTERTRIGRLSVPDASLMVPSPDGRILAVAAVSPDGGEVVQLWDVEVERKHLDIAAPGGVRSLAFSTDGGTLATVVDTSVIFWDVRTGAKLQRPLGLSGGQVVWSLAYTLDGEGLVTSSDRSQAQTSMEETILWNLDTRTPIQTFPVGGEMTLSPDGRTAALGNDDGSVRLLDLRSGRVRLLAGQGLSPLPSLAFSPDGRTLASADEGMSVILWDVASGTERQTLPGPGTAFALAFSPDGDTLFASAFSSSVIGWDTSGERGLGRLLTLPPGCEYCRRGFAYSRDGSLFAVTTPTSVRVFDAAGLELVRKIEGSFLLLAFNPSGTRLAAANSGDTVLFDPRSGSVVDRIPSVTLLGFSPNGSTLWVTRRVGTESEGGINFSPVSLVGLDGRTGATLSQIRLGDYVWMALSPDTTVLAATAPSGQVDVWDIDETEPQKLYSFAAPFQEPPVFSPDGRVLAAGGEKDEIRLLDARTGRQLGRPLSGPLGMIPVGFDRTATLLATASLSGEVQLWDVAAHRQIASFPSPTAEEYGYPIFSPDGRHLTILYGGAQSYIWDIDPAGWKARACAVAGRNLTRAEWEQFLPDRPYEPACPPM
jgi:serine/threonine protein kinase/WD40 repeat protein